MIFQQFYPWEPALSRARFVIPAAVLLVAFWGRSLTAASSVSLAGGTVDVSDVKLATPAMGKRTAPVAFEYSPIGLTEKQINRRADILLRRMTLAEKV